MALFDILKRKKTEKPKVKAKEKPVEKVKTEKPVEEQTPKVRKEVIIGEANLSIKAPHVTEKATDLVKNNQYVFKVFPRANKTEVKKAIENIFGVDVISVRIINVPKKKRRLGKIEGFRTGYKKAIVKIKEGQKIEVLPR